MPFDPPALAANRPDFQGRIDPSRMAHGLYNRLWARADLVMLAEAGTPYQYNHANGLHCTLAGTTPPVHRVDALGPGVDFPGTTGSNPRLIFSGKYPTGNRSWVAAAVFVPDVLSGYKFVVTSGNGANNGFYLDFNGTTLELTKGSVITIASISSALVAGAPYIAIARYDAANALADLVCRRLDTGEVKTASSTGVTATFSTDAGTTILVGNWTVSDLAFNGSIAGLYVGSNVTLTLAEMLDWSLDPWGLWREDEMPVRFKAAVGGGVTSSFSARFGAIGASGASKSAALGLSAIAGSIGSASGTKSASAGISAIAGLLAAMETAGVGTTDFNAIAGALVSVTHSTARLSTIEGKIGSIGSVVGLRSAISSLQAIAGSVASIAGTTSLDRTSSFAAIAGAAAALSKTTARIAELAAMAGVLGTNTAATIRAAQIAAVAGLRAAIAGINVETAGRLLTVSVSAQAAYECAVSARAAYNCTVSEAIVQ